MATHSFDFIFKGLHWSIKHCFESPAIGARVVRKELKLPFINIANMQFKYIIEAIDQNPKAVADYISGKETALKFVVGQVMRLTKGQANPGMVNDLVQKKLEAIKTA